MPEYTKPHLESSFERDILMNMVYPHLTPREARTRADLYAMTAPERLKKPSTVPEYLLSSIKAGIAERDAGALYKNIMESGGEPTPEQEKELEDIERRRREAAGKAPRNDIWGDIARDAGRTLTSLVMTGDGALRAVAGSAAAALIGAKTGAMAGTAVAPGPGTAAGAGAGAVLAGGAYLYGRLSQAHLNQQVYMGLSYEKMRKAGINHDTAKVWARADAAGQVILESVLEAVIPEGILSKALGKKLSAGLVKRGAALATAGQAARWLGRDILKGGINVVSEGVEEASQELWSNAALGLAAARQDGMYRDVDWDAIDENMGDIGEAFKGGVSMAMWLGVIPAARAVYTDVRNVKTAQVISERIRAVLAVVPDAEAREEILKEEFPGLFTDSGYKRLALTDLPEARKFDALSPPPIEGRPAPFRVGNDGKLRGRHDNGSFVFRDPDGAEYGRAEYDAEPDESGGGTVRIRGIDITNGNITNPEELKGRVLRDIAGFYPEYNVEWDAKDETERDVRDAAQKLIGIDRDAAAASDLTDRFKEFIGLKGVEWTTEMPPLTDAERADVAAKGDRIAGFFAHKNALRPHDVIYLGKKHKFHTIAHEGFHGKLAGMSEAELAPWARAVGIENTKEGWNEERFTGRDGNKTSAHEYIAEAWEDYLTDRNSQAVPDSLRGLFDRMAAAMRRVFEALGRAMREVPPELKTLMDNLAAGEAARMEAENAGGKINDGSRDGGDVSENRAAGGEEAVIHEAGEIYREAAGTSPVVVEASDDSDGIRFALEHSDKPTQKKVAEEVSRGKTGTPEQIAEARRQYDEVVSRYTNSDGTKTAGWLKAPNGKPTKLTERQWVQVRTQFFKDNFFGDWEKLAGLTVDSATANLAKTKEALSRLSGVDLVNDATGITARIGVKQRNKLVSTKALNKSLDNGFTVQQHNAAAARIDTLWKYAEQIAEHPDRNNDANIKSIKRFAVPVVFGEETGIAYITVKESLQQGHRIYSVELQEIKKPRLKGSTLKERTTATGSDLSIVQMLEKVNKNISAVRDAETGEPLVVYHAGTFRKEDIPLPAMHFGTYKAANNRINRKRKNKESYMMNEVFLNIKNPSPQPDWGLMWKSPVEYAKKDGHDGILYTNKYEDIGSQSFIAFNPEQAKSATDNAGTFGGDTGSILYSLEESGDQSANPGGSVLETPGAGAENADNAGMDLKGKLLDAEGRPVTPEKAREIIEKAKAAKPVEITGKEVPASADLKEYRQNALKYGVALRGEYTNRDTGRKTKLTRGAKNGGLNEVLHHDYKDIPHLASVAAIPDIIRDGIFIASIENEDRAKHPEIAAYDYYVAGLKIGTKDFTVKAVVATDKQGNRYYDHKLTEMEKGKLLDPAFWITSPGRGQGGLELDKIKDKRLTAILSSLFQTESPPDTPLSPDSPENSSPENDSGLLFQLTRAEEVEEARESVRRGRSREEFINDRLESGAEAGDDAPGGAEDEAEAREWLGSVYDEAKGLAERRLTSGEADDRFIADMGEERGKNGKFRDFMELSGELLSGDAEGEAADALRAGLKAVAKGGEKSKGYVLFENAARSVYAGNPLKESTKRSLITYMGHDAGRFRDLYTRVTEDPEYVKIAETEIYEDYETGIADAGRLSTYEYGRAKEKIRDKALREKIEAGTAADADYLKVIEEADRRIRELEAERAEAEKAADGKADAGRFLGIKERQAGRKCLKTARTVRVKLRIAACSPPPLTFWNLKPVYLTHV